MHQIKPPLPRKPATAAIYSATGDIKLILESEVEEFLAKGWYDHPVTKEELEAEIKALKKNGKGTTLKETSNEKDEKGPEGQTLQEVKV